MSEKIEIFNCLIVVLLSMADISCISRRELFDSWTDNASY